MSSPPEMFLFLGRLHPLLVHLPIAFILLLAVLELLARSERFRHANAGAGIILALAVPASLFSVLFGWMLSLGGGYQYQLLSWHKWTGVATASCCLLAAMLYSLNHRKSYRWSLFAGVLVLLVTSHFGGSLTHGSDYLVRYAPAPLKALLGLGHGTNAASVAAPDIRQKRLFASLVQPILNQNCVSCHGPEKSKAGLRLDSLEAMLKGGESGPAIVPGKAAESALMKRVHLPMNSDDHMPPEGKPQPDSADLALLQWWIDSGASTSSTVAQLKPPPDISRIIDARSGTTLPAPKVLAAKPLQELLPELEKLSIKANVPIGLITSNEPWLQCSASLIGTDFGDAELAALAPVAPNLRWLDLGGTAITDDGLKHLDAMRNVTRLHLERTHISDSGLFHLAALSNLEYLNLYATGISDSGLEVLHKLPKLRQVYLWETKVTPESARAFAESRVDKDQVQRWEREIDQLKSKIRETQFFVLDTGAPGDAVGATNAAPVNTQCPVSGKPIDLAKTLTHNGKLVAFCCDDCKAKFQQDPTPFLAKLEPAMPKPEKTEAKK